jgi:hypothetical protein
MRLCTPIRRLDCNFDYESFTQVCFSADMNWVRGCPRNMGALLKHDHGTRSR